MSKLIKLELSRKERLNLILEGIASTMQLYSDDIPTLEVTDPEQRLRRSWERVGQALQRAMDRFAHEELRSA